MFRHLQRRHSLRANRQVTQFSSCFLFLWTQLFRPTAGKSSAWKLTNAPKLLQPTIRQRLAIVTCRQSLGKARLIQAAGGLYSGTTWKLGEAGESGLSCRLESASFRLQS